MKGSDQINQLIEKIDAYSVDQNRQLDAERLEHSREVSELNARIEQLEKRIEQLGFDLQYVQKELENYYLLSRQQSDLLNANAELHQRAVDLLVRKSN